ncbi:MAG: SAM-dependent methyltransferase [Pseudonocardiaceae bacterium]|nr:SAM-dependent methyltransferase [Pseudonocardiaceae bacterium]
MGDDDHRLASMAIDESIPSIARIYDYLLGGKDNFTCDRELAARLLDEVPEARALALDNRAFLGRAVRFLAEQGIRQFIDIGTGLPTQQNVHEIVQEVAPESRVVYVDHDPIVLVHARALLADNPRTIVVDSDLRRPDELLANPEVRNLIDFNQPVGFIMVGILYFILNKERPFDVVARYRDAMPPGSYLALSHIVSDDNPEGYSQAQELYRGFLKRSGDARRSREEVCRFFDGFELVDPGLVYACDWRPGTGTPAGDEGPSSWVLGGVARKD